MKYFIQRFKPCFLLAITAITVFTSCNKEVETISGTGPVPPLIIPAGPALAERIKATPTDSMYYRVIVRAGMEAMLNVKTTTYTMFVPNNDGMKLVVSALSGGAIPPTAPDATFYGFINSVLPVATATGLVSYNTVPQALKSADIPSTFPNYQYPCLINPAPTVSPLPRLNIFPTTRNGAWLNNVPVVAVDDIVANGVIQHTAVLALAPQRAMWERINTDADLTILKAGIQRADSGVAPTTSASLIWALSNYGPNLTVFAPSNQAMKNAISFLTGGAIPPTAPDATFIGFLGTNNVTTQLIKGLVVYHILGAAAFMNNLPTTAAAFPTLLNAGIPTHPGITLQCTFGPTGVTAATCKGVINPTASNIAINPTPDSNPSYGTIPNPPVMTYIGTSDQLYINGTLHKIDQVMLPQ